ncbi:MAG: YaaC family protein [Bacteroidota bacterium]
MQLFSARRKNKKSEMAELKVKYGFPLFTNPATTVYLGYDKKLIISDVWAFWDYVIKKKNRNTKFLLSLLEQAKNFYKSAEIAPIKSQPLLYYYSFLNLAKIILNFEHNYGEIADYIHGISERNNTTFITSDITIQPITRPGRVKVASELYEHFNQVSTTTNK